MNTLIEAFLTNILVVVSALALLTVGLLYVRIKADDARAERDGRVIYWLLISENGDEDR